MGCGLTVGRLSYALGGSAEVLSDVVHQVLLLVLSASEDLPELARLDEVGVGDLGLVLDDAADPLLVGRKHLVLRRLDDRRRVVCGDVVLLRPVVGDVGCAIPPRRVVHIEGPVRGKLLVVHSQPVTLGLAVGEHADLEDCCEEWLISTIQRETERREKEMKKTLTWVRGNIPARDNVGRIESRLLSFGVEVLDVLVERDLSKGNQREVLLRDGLGGIEDVGLVVLGLQRIDDLGVDRPRRVVSLFDGSEEVLLEVVGILTTDSDGLIIGEVLYSLIRLEVDLDVFERSILFALSSESVSS